MRRRVVITGLGVIAPNANGVQAFDAALRAMQLDVYGEPWGIDSPAAEQNLSRRVKTATSIAVEDPILMTLDDPQLERQREADRRARRAQEQPAVDRLGAAPRPRVADPLPDRIAVHFRKAAHVAEHLRYRVVVVRLHHVGQLEVAVGGFLLHGHRVGEKFRQRIAHKNREFGFDRGSGRIMILEKHPPAEEDGSIAARARRSRYRGQ